MLKVLKKLAQKYLERKTASAVDLYGDVWLFVIFRCSIYLDFLYQNIENNGIFKHPTK